MGNIRITKRLKKCLIIAGLFAFCICLYLLSFIFSKPTIDTDYLAQLNQINLPENYKQEDNAWPYYQKAFDSFVEPNVGKEHSVIYSIYQKDFSDINDIEQKFVADWIAQNDSAWREFIQASQKPYCYYEYKIQ